MTESDRTGGSDEEPHAPAEARPPEPSESGSPIAIIGMACRFPGADDIGAFWRLLDAGENAVQEGVPGSGLGRVGALFPDDTGQIDACRFGAWLDEIDQFDAVFFRISPVEAHLLDPQQRLILETSWRALEDAGLDPERLKDSCTGVYAGISNNSTGSGRRSGRQLPGLPEVPSSLHLEPGFLRGPPGSTGSVYSRQTIGSSFVRLKGRVSGPLRGGTPLLPPAVIRTPAASFPDGRRTCDRRTAGQSSPPTPAHISRAASAPSAIATSTSLGDTQSPAVSTRRPSSRSASASSSHASVALHTTTSSMPETVVSRPV